MVGCIHPWSLAKVIPEIDPEIARVARNTKLSNRGAMNQQIALSEWPKFKAGQDERWNEAACIEYVEKDERAVRKVFDDYRYGDFPTHCSPLTMMNSRKDPTRAPSPSHCAMYLYHFAPRILQDGGLQGWKKHKHIESPLDMHNHSASMMDGDIFGIGSTIGQMMGRRPIAELSQYRVPGLDGLYLSGPFMHPGGAQQGNWMKLYFTDGTEMLEVTKIEAERTRLVVTGTMMGAMPMEIVLTGPEMRKVFPLLSFNTVWSAIRLLLTGQSEQP